MFQQLERKPGFDWQRLPDALSNQSGQIKFYISTSNRDNACSLQKSEADFQRELPLHELANSMSQICYCICRVEKNSMNRAARIDTAFDVSFTRRELFAQIQT